MSGLSSGVAAIAFHRGGEPFHVVEVGEAPLVWIEAPLAQDDGRLLVRLGASHPRERVSLLLLYSADDAGRTWQLVALDPPNGEVLVDPQTLPGGDADLQAVKAAGYDDAQIVEIVLHVALNTLTNYVNEVAQTDIDFPVVTQRPR